MTAVTDDMALDAPTYPGDETPGHGHPAESTYWMVGLFLAVLTGLEVSTYWWPTGTITTAALLIMMAIKFVTVALYFMHLKFDSKILRRTFFFGLGLAIACYLAALGSMSFFEDSSIPKFNDAPRIKPIPPPTTGKPPVVVPLAGE